MFISVTEKRNSGNDRAMRNCFGCICAAVFLGLFGAVYESFSHEVYSPFMMYAFGVPLVLGALPYGIMALRRHTPRRLTVNLWDSMIAALSLGCLMQGALEIYGTTNKLVIVYPILGGVFAAAAVTLAFMKRFGE